MVPQDPNHPDYGKYFRFAGTSCSAAYVTGALSLLLSQNPDLKNMESRFPPEDRWQIVEEARQILRHSANNGSLETGWKDEYFGYGLLDAYEILNTDHWEPAIAKITSPEYGENLSNKSVNIEGSAFSNYSNFYKWTLEYGKGENPSSWNEINSGFQEIREREGIFQESWTPPPSLGRGQYTLRLRVEDTLGRTFEDRIMFLVSFPYESVGLGFETWGEQNPKIEDVDEDDLDEKEVIFQTGEWIHCLDAEGVEKWKHNWEVWLDNYVREYAVWRGTPAIADLDGLPGKEIVQVAEHRKSDLHYPDATPEFLGFYLHIIDGRNGSETGAEAGYPLNITLDHIRPDTRITPAITDCDLDGVPEVILPYENVRENRTYMKRYTFQDGLIHTRELPSFSVRQTNWAIGYIEGFGAAPHYPDFVYFGNNKTIYYFRIAEEDGFLYYIDDLSSEIDKPRSLIFVDLDEDPKAEVVALGHVTDENHNIVETKVFAYASVNYQSLLPGWPVTISYPDQELLILFLDGNVFLSSADVDLNGDREIIVSLRNDIRIFNHDGTPFLEDSLKGGFALEFSTILADMTGDYYPEMSANGVPGGLFIWDKGGGMLDGFPWKAKRWFFCGAATEDLNNDGIMELVVVDEPFLEAAEAMVLDEMGDPDAPGYTAYYFETEGEDRDGNPTDAARRLDWPEYRATPTNTACLEPEIFIRGDVEDDGDVDKNDAVGILNYLFCNGVVNSPYALDVDGDDIHTIADPIRLLYHLYAGGPEPPIPFPEPGVEE